MPIRAPAAATALFLLLACHSASPEDTTLYDEQSPLSATLSAPLKAASDARNSDDGEYFEGTWQYVDANGEPVTLAVGIRARGNFRRDNCRYPPLRLNFKKSEVKSTLFAGQDKVKLVGQCGPGKRFREWLMLEYMSYRAYALLTDFHFRTRLIELTYIDSAGGKPRTDLAFIIESDEDTAKRLDARVIEESVSPSRLDAQQSALVEVFQFFIGNNDYSTSRAPPGRTCCHNSRLLESNDPELGLIPVPYDFDHAGIVDAEYARPPDNVPTSSVRERYFTGICKDDAAWAAAFATFQSQRNNLTAVFKQAKLSNKLRRETDRYVEQFFAIISDPEWARADIIEACRAP